MLVSWQAAELRFGPESLACLFLVVDDESGFLARWHDCGDVVAWDWSAAGRPAVARVGIELRHDCGSDDRLRVELEVVRHGQALERLAVTEALVVADAPWGWGGHTAAYSVDAWSVQAAVAAATAGLRRAVAAVN